MARGFGLDRCCFVHMQPEKPMFVPGLQNADFVMDEPTATTATTFIVIVIFRLQLTQDAEKPICSMSAIFIELEQINGSIQVCREL